MTSKEYFVYTVQEEIHRFKRVLEAVPEGDLTYKPHERSQSAEELLRNFEMESLMLLDIVEFGQIDFQKVMSQIKGGTPQERAEAVASTLSQLAEKVQNTSEEDWQLPARLEGEEGQKWETTREKMTWQFFFDLIHHRGQLSTYIRPMGGKVPSIYGPSGDDTSTGL